MITGIYTHNLTRQLDRTDFISEISPVCRSDLQYKAFSIDFKTTLGSMTNQLPLSCDEQGNNCCEPPAKGPEEAKEDKQVVTAGRTAAKQIRCSSSSCFIRNA